MIDPETLAIGGADGQFGWSVSRHDAFENCKRKYFYTYYGAFNDPEVKRLRDLSARLLWVGSLVHDTIETYLKTHTTIIPPSEQVELIRRVTHGQMPQDWNYSLAGTKKFRLVEHELSLPVTDWEKKVAIGIVMRCLQNFFKGEILDEMMTVGKQNWLSVEELLVLQVKGVMYRLKMDAAYRRPNGKIRIVDWKTGSSAGTHNKAQVAGYALYAFTHGWATKPEEIETTLAYLALDEYKNAEVTLETLGDAQDFILGSALNMKAMLVDAEKNQAKLGEFNMVNKDWNCKSCQYRNLCWPAWDKMKR